MVEADGGGQRCDNEVMVMFDEEMWWGGDGWRGEAAGGQICGRVEMVVRRLWGAWRCGDDGGGATVKVAMVEADGGGQRCDNEVMVMFDEEMWWGGDGWRGEAAGGQIWWLVVSPEKCGGA
nr:hypothetical protein [Tanacetum cinerariifolium]